MVIDDPLEVEAGDFVMVFTKGLARMDEDLIDSSDRPEVPFALG